MSETAITTIAFQLPEHLADALGEEAKRSGSNCSEIAREALEARLGLAPPQDAGDHATPPPIGDALAQLKQAKPPERRRHRGQMVTQTGPAISGREAARRKAQRGTR